MLDTVLDSPPAARVLAASGVPGRLVAGAEAARRDLARVRRFIPGRSQRIHLILKGPAGAQRGSSKRQQPHRPQVSAIAHHHRSDLPG